MDYSVPRIIGIRFQNRSTVERNIKYVSQSVCNAVASIHNVHCCHVIPLPQIIAVDARNHGDSPQTPDFNYSALVEDIRYLMNDLNIPKINAIGHSLGGRTMMLLALKYVSVRI